MEYKDYYKILGIEKGASEKEIKAAYRRLARKHHPDLNRNDPKAELRFKEVNEANEVLSDPEKRRRYDALGSNWQAFGSRGFGGGARPAGPGRVRVDFGGGESGFSDFFETFFGQGVGGGASAGFPDLEELLRGASMGGSGPAAGRDLEQPVELSLEEVARGAVRSVGIQEGRASHSVEVKIPPGVRDAARVRVAGEGGRARSGGARGDLYLRVRVRPHPTFVRSGDDLQTAVTLPLTTAVLGGEIEAPTLDGPVGLKVPAGSPAGRVLRLRGLGLPRLGEKGTRGDLLVQLAVAVPESLTPRERELFEELRRLGR
jgi:curved DNA-binding protein